MADKPISELPVATSAAPDDVFIINKNDQQTRKIKFGDISAATGFSPIYAKSTVKSRSANMLSVGTKYVAAGQLKDNPPGSGNGAGMLTVGAQDLITTVMATAAGQSVEVAQTECSFDLPSGADSALIVFRSMVTALSGTDADGSATVSKYGRGRVKYNSFIQGSGQFENGKINSATSCGFGISWPASAVQGRRYDMRSVDKVNAFTSTDGA